LEEKKKNSFVNIIKNLICGVAVGAGAILPGVSGGVLCVVFGIYRPLMELFVYPIKTLRKNWLMFLLVGIGWVLGFLLFANIIVWMFEISELYATWLFAGLILGTVPSIFKEAGKEGRSKASYISMIVTGIVLIAILLFVKIGLNVQVTPHWGWYLFAGVLWGVSFIIPGMSSSPVLMALDLYQPLNSALVAFDFTVIIPWLIGMAATALLLARLVNFLFKKYYSVSYHAVLGIVVASVLAVIPLAYEHVGQILLGLAIGVGGFVAAYLMERLDLKVKSGE